LGLPTALWGGLLYVAVGVLAALGLSAARWSAAFYLAAAGVGFSLYLTALSILVIGATCGYCLASTAIMVVILGVLVWRRRAQPALAPRTTPVRVAAGGVGAAALVIVAGAFVFAMPAAETPGYQGELARHLRDSGAIMYGAYWCPHCSEQKHLFGAAVKDVPYVECDAKGVNARPDLCERAGVKVYPTWVIDGARREVVQTLGDLA